MKNFFMLKSNQMKNKIFAINILLIALSLLLIIVVKRESGGDWHNYQKKWKNNKISELLRLYSKTKDEKVLKKIEKIKNFKIRKRAVYVTKWKREEYCVTCHIGIKDISSSHPSNVFGCVVCHGGDPLTVEKKEAHKGLIGGENPSDLRSVNLSCGTIAPDGTKCHSSHIVRVKNSLMYTMAGVIADLRYQWNAQQTKDAVYATNEIKGKFKKVPFFQKSDVPENYNEKYEISGKIADSHFRKFCSMCHIGVKNPNDTSNHSSGCSACHVLYENSSRYKGDDPTINKDEEGHPPYHEITDKIPSKQCIHCHNRSNRYGTSYMGIAENDFYGTPFINGDLSEQRLIGGRFFYHLNSDIHFKKGMQCIDCHLSRGIMGDGNVYGKMEHAVKIKCRDCHGYYDAPPKTHKITSFNDKIFKEHGKLKKGEEVVVAESGEIISNVKKEGKHFFLYTKTKGKKLRLKIISNDKNHKLNNCNKNLECYSCHYSWTMLCFGCHTGYNKNYPQRDFLTNLKTKGMWYEYRSFTRYSDTVLCINGRGKVSPAQFCQSQVTFPDKGYYNKVFTHNDNTTSYVVAPVQPHTVSEVSRKCRDCHNNPMAVGLGKGYLKFTDKEKIIFKPLYNVKKAGIPVNFPFESIVSANGKIQFQSVSNRGFKVFKREKILKILRVGKCVQCHNSYSDKIYLRNNFPLYYSDIKKKGFKHIKEKLDSIQGY